MQSFKNPTEEDYDAIAQALAPIFGAEEAAQTVRRRLAREEAAKQQSFRSPVDLKDAA